MHFAVLALVAALMAGLPEPCHAISDSEIERIVAQSIEPMIPGNEAGGAAAAVRKDGRTLFFNYGFADLAAGRRITSDSMFNLASLRKVFEATLFALALKESELQFDEPVVKYVPELQEGGYIRRVTLGQLATHTSGLLLPTDHPPWPKSGYTLPQFVNALNAWKPEQGEEPGKQHIYTHAGYVLLALALERRFATPIGELIQRRVLEPLGMSSTLLPERGADRALYPLLMRHAVQGYSQAGDPIGAPGDQQGYFDFPGMGQMFSSARDLVVLIAAHLGERPVHPTMREALQLTRQGVFRMNPRTTQALAWEINDFGRPVIVDKPGGLNNSSTYIGIVPERRLGLVILSNRGGQDFYEMTRRSLVPALAR